jgi:Fe-S-cluster containining protein
MCGSCCRAGLEVVIEKEDIRRWIQHERNEFAKYIQIDPKCISYDGLAGYHIEEFNTLEKIKEKFKEQESKRKIEELHEFILKNHEYLGKGPPLPIYTFLEDLGRMPILVPKDLMITIKGMELELVYILKFEEGGYCPFIKENLCSIHEIKPNVCKTFPYNKEGFLKIDDFFTKICKGLRLEPSV